MNRYRRLIIVLIVAVAITDAEALVSPAEVPVMYAPVTARATALGNALYCAEYESIRYNPAYLALVGPAEFDGTYGALGRGSYFGNAAVHCTLGKAGWGFALGTIGSSFDQFATADLPQTGTVSASQSLLSVGTGIKVRGDPHLLAGAALRVLLDAADGASDIGSSLDIGIGYLFNERMKAGLTLHNLAAATTGNSDDTPPLKSVLALSWQPALRLRGQKNTAANTAFFAAGKDIAAAPGFSFGWESVFHDMFAVRLGYDRSSPSLGVGFRFSGVAVDFAATMKEQGMLYFTTLGWRMGQGDDGTVTAEKQENTPEQTAVANEPREQTPAQDDTAAKAAALVKEGRAQSNAQEEIAKAKEKEYDTALRKAQQLAEQGRYAEAVSTITAACEIDGLPVEDARKARGLAASYEYVGKMFSKTYLDKAQEYLDARQYPSADACLNRVIRCGFGADEARQLLNKVNAARSSPPAPEDPLGGRSVRETLDAAIALYNRGEFDACRAQLLRVLNAEPNNAEARQYMEKLEGTLGRRKKIVPLRKKQ